MIYLTLILFFILQIILDLAFLVAIIYLHWDE
jgi:hypothetical protein